MELELAAIPSVVRTSTKPKEPNPFIDGQYGDVIRKLPVDAEPGTPDAALTVTVPGIMDKTNKEFQKVARQLRDAGNARGVTMRQKHEEVKAADGKPGVKITFYAVTRIERKTKAEIEAAKKLEAEAAAKAAETEAVEAGADSADKINAESANETAPVLPIKQSSKRGTTRTTVGASK
jgi:hypothetical protein